LANIYTIYAEQHFLYRDFPDNLNKTTLTTTKEQFTIHELVEATKNMKP